MIKVGDQASWTHVGSGRRTLSMSLREGVVEDISTEREPYMWRGGEKVDMTGRELIIRCTTMHDDDTDFDYVVVARAAFPDEGIYVFDGSKQECERYVDECTPHAMMKKKRGRERIAVARLRVKGQKSQISEFVEAVVETTRG